MLPASLEKRLAIPAIVAPMFLVSGPDLVVRCCEAGLLGTFPALNQRTSEGFGEWLDEIEERLASTPGAAPFGVNLIVHKSNPRLGADLELSFGIVCRWSSPRSAPSRILSRWFRAMVGWSFTT
jgi:nitronate monooxygenase